MRPHLAGVKYDIGGSVRMVWMPWTPCRPHCVQSGKYDTRQRGSDLAKRIMMYVVGIGPFPVTKLFLFLGIEGKAMAVRASAGQASDIISQGVTVSTSRLWAKDGKSGPHQHVQPGVWSVHCGVHDGL